MIRRMFVSDKPLIPPGIGYSLLLQMQTMLHLLTLVPLVSCSFIKVFNLEEVSLDPPPKPKFLMNATHEVIEQFMAIYKTPSISAGRKVTELDVLIGTLRTEVQESWQAYKAEASLLKLGQDERMQEVAEKVGLLQTVIYLFEAHYTMAHMDAMKNSRTLGLNERKTRTELVFAEFSQFMVGAITDEVSNALHSTMHQILRAILFTDKLSQK